MGERLIVVGENGNTLALTPPLGAYMHRVYTREGVGRAEGVVYRIIGVRPTVEQSWRRYASCVLWFSAIGTGLVYALLRLQGSLPWNPQGLPGVGGPVAFNTAVSFTTNTNWQAYGGETTMSYLSQMLALTFQNFVSAAVGMAVLIAMIRGFTRSGSDEVGNFWRDLVRGVVYILLPLSTVVALVLVSQGVVQTLQDSDPVRGIQGFAQLLARGPAASQVAIKQPPQQAGSST
jgi:K+-transporting ATPase ATPase A chain